MIVQNLGSSSAGNCTLLRDGSHILLIDCGFPTTYTRTELGRLNLNYSHISGLLITHIHGDHINKWTLKALIENRVPVYCSTEIAKILERKFDFIGKSGRTGIIHPVSDDMLNIAGFRVTGFPVLHDSEGGCLGYSIFKGNNGEQKKITIATDLGNAENGLEEKFADSDVIIIESNHDEEMLENSGRPYILIQRIKKTGHLSNRQCSEFMLTVLKNSVKLPSHIMLAHISQQCNTNKLAAGSLADMLKINNYRDIEIVETFKDRPSKKIVL
jgi:phosphoribosyl 1,2-cyclic phosphodiesterase